MTVEKSRPRISPFILWHYWQQQNNPYQKKEIPHPDKDALDRVSRWLRSINLAPQSNFESHDIIEECVVYRDTSEEKNLTDQIAAIKQILLAGNV